MLFSGKHPKKVLKNLPSILSDTEVLAMKINPKNYDYPFENLVFEGGGNKGLAYCGAVKVILLFTICHVIRCLLPLCKNQAVGELC